MCFHSYRLTGARTHTHLTETVGAQKLGRIAFGVAGQGAVHRRGLNLGTSCELSGRTGAQNYPSERVRRLFFFSNLFVTRLFVTVGSPVELFWLLVIEEGLLADRNMRRANKKIRT